MRTNKTQAKKLLLLCLAILIPLLVKGETVCINGIYYNLISKVKQAEVIQGDAWYSGNKTIPPSVTYNDTEYIVTSIGNVAFYKCWDLTSISIPETVTNIGVNAFNGCSNLKSIDLPSGLTNLGSSALGYTGITSVIIPDGVKTIEDHVFAGCSRLNSITFSDSITAIGNYAFLDCCNLNNVSIPSSIKSIGDGAFSGCSSLTSIILPNGITKIEDSAFYNCSGLTSITIPEGVISVGYCALAGCSRLTTIIIPNGLTTIEWYAFASCTNLKEVFLPESIVTIEEKSFKNCSNLEDVYCCAKNIPSTEADAFEGSYPEYATLHVPASAVNEYKNTAPWSSFGKVETFEITVDEITLSQSAAELIEGESLQLTATVSPDDAEDQSISWSSNHPRVATVDHAGKVTAIAPGTATITVTANDGSGVSAQCEVTVNELILGKCATPTISYVDGKVVLTCETEGAKVITTVTNGDDEIFEVFDFELIPTYTITAYATKGNYENSDPVSLTICWVPCTEEHEKDDADGILTIPSKPVLIQCQGGVITVSGLADGTEVAVYTTSGTLVATAEGDTTHLTVPTGQVYIVKVADTVVKIGM